ncbi:hypothetical protein NEUTE2DRAFT_170652 [Neurospora tetrasperma FGSC 2509]|nr:hypothetical protein NEUTE2DRAFT_170652 [Neurospora tetrasperma FGSC 2509]
MNPSNPSSKDLHDYRPLTAETSVAVDNGNRRLLGGHKANFVLASKNIKYQEQLFSNIRNAFRNRSYDGWCQGKIPAASMSS